MGLCELKVHGKAITVPGRALAAIIGSLKTSLEPDSFELLQSYHQPIVNHLRAVSIEVAPGTEIGEMQQRVAFRLGALKTMVAPC